MTKTTSILSICLLSTLTFSCMNNGSKQQTTSNACHPDEKIIRTVSNQTGLLMKDQSTGKMSISVHTPGTIDEVSNYLICNPCADMPRNESQVTFSGNVRTSDIPANLGGMTNYELEMTSIKPAKK